MSARSTPIPLPTPSGATSEVRVLSVPSAAPASGAEPTDPALAWLDAQLAEDMQIDESAIDLLAMADDTSALPIGEDELTPPRPSRVPSTIPPRPSTRGESSLPPR